MTSIGFATLQIIPSLEGVSEAIEKQVAGKVVPVKVQAQVDTRAAQKAGKEAGETVTKEVNSAVRKGNIGKTVNDEIKSSTKSGGGKEAAKSIVDGLADGIKSELPKRGLSRTIVDGIAEGVKQGIDGVGIGGQVVDTIGKGVKSGNLRGTLRDAIVPAIKGIGDELRTGAASWSGDIANSLRSGDIKGATDEISNTVTNTTNLIADIGDTFGFQLDGVRNFGNQASTILSDFGTDIQKGIDTAGGIKTTLNTVGDILETALPGRAGRGAAKITAALAAISIPTTIAVLLTELGMSDDPRFGNRGFVGQGGGLTKPLAGFQPGGPLGISDGVFGSSPPPQSSFGGPGAQRDRRGAPPAPGLFGPNGFLTYPYSSGGYTGAGSADMIAGVVHGGEYVINARATAGIQNAMPGLLDYLNNKGALPGYGAGGLVAGTDQLRSIIAQKFGISNIGGWRPADRYGEHSTGRALDVMTSNKATGDAIKDFVVANASAIDLKWAIWQQKLWYPDGSSKAMADRGSPTQNHMDHVHIFSGTGITNGLRGALAANGTQGDYAPTMMGEATTVGMIGGADMTPAMGGAGGSSKVTLASSFSGLAGTGLDKLNMKTKAATPGAKDLSLDIGNAASAAVGGQVSSLLGGFGINDSPGWLKGIAGVVNAISVNDGAGSAMPLSAAGSAVSAAGSALGSVQSGSGARPGPVTTYNIQTTDIEPAYLASQRLERERAAATLAVY